MTEIDGYKFAIAEMAKKHAEEIQRLRTALEEIYEYSKHDGISKYLDNCYVVARKALEQNKNRYSAVIGSSNTSSSL